MSNLPVAPSRAVCANCAYWGGDRTINGFFGRAEVSQDGHSQGTCLNKYGFFNCTCSWQGTCSHFEKHPAIK